MRLLVIGGSDAGISAALRARELDPTTEVTVLVADAFPNFSICGLPYYLSGEVTDRRDLAHRHLAQLQDAGLRLLLEHTAQAVDPAASQVIITNQHGQQQDLAYDQLIIATGAAPARPPIPGLDRPAQQRPAPRCAAGRPPRRRGRQAHRYRRHRLAPPHDRRGHQRPRPQLRPTLCHPLGRHPARRPGLGRVHADARSLGSGTSNLTPTPLRVMMYLGLEGSMLIDDITVRLCPKTIGSPLEAAGQGPADCADAPMSVTSAPWVRALGCWQGRAARRPW
jgi:Pyridine nucleotide-disulphide oxidoreductase